MRPFSVLAAFALATLASMSAQGETASTRADVLRDGKGRWTVDVGGPLGPIEVLMTRKGDKWVVTLHGTYPIMDSAGGIQPIASQAMFWLTDVSNRQIVNVNGSLQTLAGRWEPGQDFDVTFAFPAKQFDDHPHTGLHIALGDASRSLPSAGLEPPP